MVSPSGTESGRARVRPEAVAKCGMADHATRPVAYTLGYRRWAVWIWLLPSVLVMAAIIYQSISQEPGNGREVMWGLALFFAVITLLNGVLLSRHTLRLSPDGISRRLASGWPAHGKTVPWPLLTGVQETPHGLRITTAQMSREIRRPSSRSLVARLMPHDDAYGTVMEWWRRYGTPPPSAAATPNR